uniref:Uncharacterized protein n=1 Tax=Globodera rostochiensis TaxID=31243 RepID=A0A914GVS8_GLORO
MQNKILPNFLHLPAIILLAHSKAFASAESDNSSDDYTNRVNIALAVATVNLVFFCWGLCYLLHRCNRKRFEHSNKGGGPPFPMPNKFHHPPGPIIRNY